MNKLNLPGEQFIGFMPSGQEDTRSNEQKAEDLLDRKVFNAFPDISEGTLAIDIDSIAYVFDGRKWIEVSI